MVKAIIDRNKMRKYKQDENVGMTRKTRYKDEIHSYIDMIMIE